MPAAFSPEQVDLIKSPTREKDRQKYLAMAEFYEDSRVHLAAEGTIDVPPAVRDADRLAQQGDLDKALAAYRLQLELCKDELTSGCTQQNRPIQFSSCSSKGRSTG
jgi:hypothetical protein